MNPPYSSAFFPCAFTQAQSQSNLEREKRQRSASGPNSRGIGAPHGRHYTASVQEGQPQHDVPRPVMRPQPPAMQQIGKPDHHKTKHDRDPRRNVPHRTHQHRALFHLHVTGEDHDLLGPHTPIREHGSRDVHNRTRVDVFGLSHDQRSFPSP